MVLWAYFLFYLVLFQRQEGLHSLGYFSCASELKYGACFKHTSSDRF